MEAIRNFSVPKTISDLRGWFGLVNQISPFYATRPVLLRFRELLKPPATGKMIYWDENLTQLFKESKAEIIANLKTGIEIFRIDRTTILATDWSKDGMGYVLSQKKCNCEKMTPRCCDSGWATILVGSCF